MQLASSDIIPFEQVPTSHTLSVSTKWKTPCKKCASASGRHHFLPATPSQDNRGVVYGTNRGTIGHLGVAPDGANFLKKTWELPAARGTGSSFGGASGGSDGGRGVTALKACDLTHDGVQELIAGREDGTITVRGQTGLCAGGREEGKGWGYACDSPVDCSVDRVGILSHFLGWSFLHRQGQNISSLVKPLYYAHRLRQDVFTCCCYSPINRLVRIRVRL